MDSDHKTKIEQIKSIELLESHLKLLHSRLAQYEDDLERVTAKLERKTGKLDSLRRLSILSLYKRILGDHSRSLELYEQHCLDLSLEFNDLIKSIELVEYEIDLIEQKYETQHRQKEQFKAELLKMEHERIPTHLEPYRKLLDQMAYNVRLIKELEEAIKAGQAINRKFNSAIRFTKKMAVTLYDKDKDIEKLKNYKISDIDKFHNYLVAINHSFIKYQSEVEDVYREILSEETHMTDGPLTSFMGMYRERLVRDLKKAKDMNFTFNFLKDYKGIIMTLNRALRSDLKKSKARLAELEDRERTLLNNIDPDRGVAT